jgi:3-hydroxyisobutyrate dehydrogenase-like beta-hydroxyacid dehydrogenase
VTDGRQWLVVGHGSVGSFVTERLVRRGAAVAVLDPAPRVPVAPERVADLGRLHGRVDFVVSCVSPEAAQQVPGLLDGALRPGATVFEWNSISPAEKRAVRDAIDASTVDVALLDSLDGVSEHPNLALSGGDVDAAAALLTEQGYNVAVVGDEVGQAASVKYLRSVFMKGLEALVLEYAALAHVLDTGDVVRASLAANLGPEFIAFMDLLVATDRLHAARRQHELAQAIETLAEDGISLAMAPAAVDVLRRAADAWTIAGAPPPGAAAKDLVSHLQRTLWPPTPST